MEDILCVSYGRNHLCYFYVLYCRIFKQEMAMTWIKIDRDENGFATEECTKEALKQLPIVIRGYDELGEYHHLLTEDSLECDKMAIFKFKTYTHYLPIPEV